MDIFATTVTAIHEVYAITIFIHRVTKDAKDKETQKTFFQQKLDHESVFIETFADIYVDGNEALFWRLSGRDNLKVSINNTLDSLQKTLTGYRTEAVRHGITLHENSSSALGNKSTGQQKGHREKLKAKIESTVEKWRKDSPLDWALFTKDKIEQLLVDYSGWTLRLRQDLELIVLLGCAPIAGDALGNLGIQAAVERQHKLEKLPPAAFGSLVGHLNQPVSDLSDATFGTNSFQDESGFEEIPVLVEVRNYSDSLQRAINEGHRARVKELKQPVRELAWLLHDPPNLEHITGNTSVATADRMNCIGFIDQPDISHGRALILYRLPHRSQDAASITTLHDLMSRNTSSESTKPALGVRFAIAHALASTLLGIQISGWVHKNITSRSIVMLSPDNPNLVGWATARRVMGDSAVQEEYAGLETNIYHHPRRYGKPSARFINEYDIYALGVVMLEIGLWKPMSALFKAQIKISREKGQLPPVNIVHTALLRHITGDELKREMGVQFARVVERCLTSHFEVNEDDEKQTKLAVNFRNLIVDVLRTGTLL